MAKKPIWTITPHELNEVIHQLKKHMSNQYESHQKMRAEYMKLQRQSMVILEELHKIVLNQVEENGG